MSVPALNIPIRADVDKFRQDMQATGAAGTAAIKKITTSVIEMNAGWLASKGAAGAATLAFGRIVPVVGQVVLAYKAVTSVIGLMNYATDLAKAKIEEFNDVADKANASGFSTEFFQRVTKGGATATVTIDALTEALKRFNEASTDRLGGSQLQQRLDQLNKAGNFGGVGAIVGSDAESKLRSVVALIEQALDRGERLAAIDLANTAFGPKVADAIRSNSNYLNDMLKRADALSKTQIISQEDLGRAIELKDRMEAAQKVLSERWKTIKDDLAKLGMNYHESWVGVTEVLAKAVGLATDFYSALKDVPNVLAGVGNASIWKKITDATESLGLNSSPESMGISTDPKEIAQVDANNKLRAALQNYRNITLGMQQASDVQSAVRGDTSKAPEKPKNDAADAYDRATESVVKHTARLEADTEAVGKGAAAQAELRAEAQLYAAAAQAGIPTTQALKDKIQDLAQDAGDAAAALEKAKVASQIKFDRGTAFLSSEDVSIARQLAGIYGDDIPKALASSEAAEMRFNNALKDVSQSLTGPLTSGLTDILDGTKSVSQGFADLGKVIIRSLEEAIVKIMIVQPLMRGLTGLFGGASGGTGLLAGIGSLFGFAAGGYTGAGGKYQPAGIVHRGEYVMDAASTSRIGIANLDRLRGYANGGAVGMPAVSGGAAQSATPAEPQNVHVTVGVEVDNNGNLQSYVKNISQDSARSTLKGFLRGPEFPQAVATGLHKTRQRNIRS